MKTSKNRKSFYFWGKQEQVEGIFEIFTENARCKLRERDGKGAGAELDGRFCSKPGFKSCSGFKSS
jgi:hypothetical protein